MRTPGAVNGHFQIAFEKYRHFSARVHARPSTDLSDHLQFAEGSAIPLDEVEPVSSIVKRFSTAAMLSAIMMPLTTSPDVARACQANSGMSTVYV